jgi:hypothetical protein
VSPHWPEGSLPLGGWENLFASILQQFGIRTDRFASGTSTMRGMKDADQPLIQVSPTIETER